MLHDRLAVRVDLGDVHTVEIEVFHGSQYLRVAEGGFLQYFAGHTPLGKEIHQHRFACLAGISQGGAQIVASQDGLPGPVVPRGTGGGRGRCRLRHRRQGLEWIVAATERTDDHHRAIQGQHQGDAALEPGDAFAGGFKGAELHAVDRQKQAVKAQGNGAVDDAIQKPDGNTEHDHPEEAFDLFHPHAGPGQQAAAAGAKDDQRQAHAHGQGKQGGGAGEGITAGGHIDQCTGQNRGDTGRHDQGRDGPHDSGTEKAAALALAGLVQLVTQKGGQLQLIKAEHGQRQQHEDHGGGNDGRWLLQQKLQVEPGAKYRNQQAGKGIGHRHAQHIAGT